MKFLRLPPTGREKPGLIDPQLRIRDLSGFVDDVSAETIGDGRLFDVARAVDVEKLPVVPDGVRIGPRVESATGPGMACGVVVELGGNGLCHRIEPVRIGTGLAEHIPEFG